MSTHLTPLTKEFRSQEYVTYLSTRCSETSFKKPIQISSWLLPLANLNLIAWCGKSLSNLTSSSMCFSFSKRATQYEHSHSPSNIRTIIEALFAEYDLSIPTTGASLTARNFRRVRLSLSPLFVIEANLMQILAPELKDATKDVCVRAGSGWKALLQAHQS